MRHWQTRIAQWVAPREDQVTRGVYTVYAVGGAVGAVILVSGLLTHSRFGILEGGVVLGAALWAWRRRKRVRSPETRKRGPIPPDWGDESWTGENGASAASQRVVQIVSPGPLAGPGLFRGAS